MAKVNCIETLKAPSYILSKNGILFTKSITLSNAIKIALNCLFDVTVVILIAANIKNAIRENNVKLINWMTCVLLPMANYIARRLTLLVNKKYLSSLLADLKSDIFNKHKEKLNRPIQEVNRVSSVMFKYFAITMTIGVTAFCILPLVTNSTLMILPLPFESPPLVTIYKYLHIVIGLYLAINTASFDIFYLTILGLDVAQLKVLGERLTSLLEVANEGMPLKILNSSGNIHLIIENILKECVHLHYVIIEFTRKINVLLGFPLFIQYTSGCVVICNAILQLTIMRDTDIVNIIGISCYSSVVLVEMAAYHWIANEIISNSGKIVQSCYLSNWYEMNARCQRYILLLMERSRRPLIIQVYNFIDISLDSLGVVVRWSYSIFALIRARYN